MLDKYSDFETLQAWKMTCKILWNSVIRLCRGFDYMGPSTKHEFNEALQRFNQDPPLARHISRICLHDPLHVTKFASDLTGRLPNIRRCRIGELCGFPKETPLTTRTSTLRLSTHSTSLTSLWMANILFPRQSDFVRVACAFSNLRCLTTQDVGWRVQGPWPLRHEIFVKVLYLSEIEIKEGDIDRYEQLVTLPTSAQSLITLKISGSSCREFESWRPATVKHILSSLPRLRYFRLSCVDHESLHRAMT